MEIKQWGLILLLAVVGKGELLYLDDQNFTTYIEKIDQP